MSCCPLAPRGTSASGRAPGSRARWRDLGLGEHHVVLLELAGHGERAVDHADLPLHGLGAVAGVDSSFFTSVGLGRAILVWVAIRLISFVSVLGGFVALLGGRGTFRRGPAR